MHGNPPYSEPITPRSDKALLNRLRRGIALLFILSATGYSQLEEMPLKAFFLEAAIRFISWPADSTAIPSDLPNRPFTIGYYNGDKFIPYLKQSFGKKQVKGKNTRFLMMGKAATIDSCDMLVIPASKKAELADLIASTRNKPILTVCDQPEFTRKGVIIGIAAEKKKVNCYINAVEAQKSHLSISHHLLQKSKVVLTGGTTP